MDGELLCAERVSVAFRGSALPAVADVDLSIQRGACIGIVGESGSGKSTLARALSGAITPTSGAVLVAGAPWSTVRRSDRLRAGVQMVFQDVYGALNPRMSAQETVSEVLRVWQRMDRRSAAIRAEELLAETGLRGALIRRPPRRLSGGQCQRVGIARALACDPEVLIADEPTSSLDVSVQAQILNLLLELRERRGLALVLISHDLAVIRYVCEYVLVMYQGRIVERGPVAQIFSDPRSDYTRTLIASIPGGHRLAADSNHRAPPAGASTAV